MELSGMELQRFTKCRDMSQLSVDEDSHRFNLFGELRPNFCCFGFGDGARTFLVEIEPQEICAGIDGGQGVGGSGDTAEFDKDHGALFRFRRNTEKSGEGGGRIPRKHEMLADEEGIEAGGAQFDEIIVGAQSGFADGNAILGDAADQFEGGLHADGESLEAAIVYAQNARTDGESAVEFFAGVYLDERFHSKLAAQSNQLAKEGIADGCYD